MGQGEDEGRGLDFRKISFSALSQIPSLQDDPAFHPHSARRNKSIGTRANSLEHRGLIIQKLNSPE